MKKMYLFCSIVVLGIASFVYTALMSVQLRTMKNSVNKAYSISKELEDQNELLEKELERLSCEIVSDAKPDVSDNDISAYPGVTDIGSSIFGNDSGINNMDYVLMLNDNKINVYYANDTVAIMIVPADIGILSEGQRTALEEGIHLKSMDEVYSFLESLTS